MKLTFLVFTILLLTSLADHHKFRHGNEDRNDHGDHNDQYNRKDSSDNENKNQNGDDGHHHDHSRSEENNGEYEINNYNEPTDNTNTPQTNTNTDSSTPDNNSNTYYSNANTDSSAPDNNSNTYYSNANTATNTNTGTSSSSSQNGGSSTSSSSSNSGSTDSYAQQCLDSHNQERNSLGLNSVTWNSDLAAASQVWAEHLASVGSLSHSSGRVHVGENVADTTHKSGVDNTVHLIGLWLDEKKYFKNGRYPDISTSGNVHDVGHYSQMIWAATSEIGCATAVGSGHDYMCCQYKTSGNVQGQQVY